MEAPAQRAEATAETPLRPFRYVDTAEAWDMCVRELEGHDRIAVDLEANSLFAYRECVCLVQISTSDDDFIVDPLAGFPLNGLDTILADPGIEKVFHASEYDLILMKRQWGWDCVNLFDTMWAARILGFTNMGLAWLLNEFYGVQLSKKYQKTNWTLRPLKPAQLAYAQTDTHYLLRLRDELAAQLDEAGRMEEAREIFAREATVRVPSREFDPEGFWSLKGVRELRPKRRALLRALYIWRDGVARDRNLPAFKVLTNDTLVRLANRAPRMLEDLDGVPGLPPRVIERYGKTILDRIARAWDDEAPQRPKRGTPRDPLALERYDKLQQWRKAWARERGVESDVILTRDSMWRVAQEHPRTLAQLEALDAFGPHGLAMYGESLLAELE